MKRNRIKKISIIAAACLLLTTTIGLIIFGALRLDSPTFKGGNGIYTNEQAEIITYKAPTASDSVDIEDLYNEATMEITYPINGYKINIDSAKDLYLFSLLANTDDAFLGYSYQLLSSINYDDYNKDFEPIGWRPGKPFTGVFNGNGYEILNLDLMKINTESEKNHFNGIKYYAMFSEIASGALVTNVGLRNTNIFINTTIEGMGIASLVGHIASGATLSYSFATDLRDPVIDEAGITAYGEYNISGLVYQNDGNLQDSYTAYTSVTNYNVLNNISFSEILFLNNGTIGNLFFYNESIKSYEEVDSKFKIEYKSPINKSFVVDTHYGSYTNSLDNLDSSLRASNSLWYSKSSYLDLASYLSGIITPIIRGIDVVKDSANQYHFSIENVQDFAYAFELMNLNAKFATNKMIYEIKDDLNLDLISPKSYYYGRSIGSTFIGIEFTDKVGSLTLSDGSISSYPTIYNPSLNKAVTEGINAYGLFPWLTGSVENLNIYIEDGKTTAINVLDTDLDKNNIKALGIVSGYANGANIDNVNVYGNIEFDNTIGKYFVGGAVGILSGLGRISNLTTAGSITNDFSAIKNYTNPNDYMEGSAIAGVVAYIDRTYGSLANLMNGMDITVYSENTTNYMTIGGVVGGGYINSLNGIENRGCILVGSQESPLGFKRLYVSGGIGRLLGIKSQIKNINNKLEIAPNNGKDKNSNQIDIYNKNNIEGYVSGILNADIITSATNFLDVSSLKSEGNYVFYASNLINASNVVIHNSLSNNGYTAGLNVIAKNGFKSSISTVSNLSTTKSIRGVETKLDPIEIDMSIINEYAPVVNYISNSANNSASLDTIYNLRDINIAANSSLRDLNYEYDGVIKGKYMSLMDISNEGNINILFNAGATSPAKSLIVNGVFSELSLNEMASNIYNGGNITIKSNSLNNNFNIYASGISYNNASELSDNKYNPLKPEFDKNSIGSLDKAINNGKISIDSDLIDFDAKINEFTTSYYKGSLYASGLIYSNSGIISNSFNLGDIILVNASYINPTSPEDKYIIASGMVYENNGRFAGIRDSSNNGIIKAINLGTANPYVYSSGIVGVNNKNSKNTNQVIAFTINYGEVYAVSPVQKKTDNATIDSNERVKAGGFLASGLCNLVNTINYGNVFSSYTAGGIIGSFKLESNMDKAIFANTLNYGIIKAINTYKTVDGLPVFAKIFDIVNIKPDNKDYIAIGQTTDPFYQSVGALIGVADYNGLDKINIRYLVNFFEGVLIVSKEIAAPANVTTDVKRLYNVSPLNKFLGKDVTYAPLSTISDADGNIGVFSPEFGFRQAIDGKNIDIATTDRYIGDFFQFIGFEKINPVIIEKIGWDQLAYMDAANRFARDLGSVVSLLNLPGINKNDAILEEALNSQAWINRTDSNILDSLISDIVNGNLTDEELKELLSFALFEAPSHNLIAKELRSNLVDQIYAYLDPNKTNAYTILNKLLYDELLAKVVANSNDDYRQISEEIRNIISKSNDLDSILDNYINALKAPGSTLVDPLFDPANENYYFEAKLKLLNVLLEGYSEDQLKSLLNLLGGENQDTQVKYLLYLEKNPTEAASIYTSMIAANDLSNAEYLRVMNQSFKRYGVSNIVATALNGPDANNMINRFNSAINNLDKTTYQGSITSLNNPSLALADYVSLWNLIKNDNHLREYLELTLSDVESIDGIKGKGIYAKATEYNNTYQSNDSPSNINSTTGKIRTQDSNGIIDTRFIFVPDTEVSSKTYYYGPYKDATNTVWFPGYSSDNYNQGFQLDTTGTGQDSGATVRYVPFFAAIDEAELIKRGATKSYPFLWSNAKGGGSTGDSSNQWVSPHILTRSGKDAVAYLMVDKRTPELEALKYDYNWTDRTSYSEATTNNFIVPAYTTPNNTNKSHQLHIASSISDMTGLLHTYSEFYLTANITADLITGIWYQQNIWKSESGELMGAYLTSKDNTPYSGKEGTYKYNSYTGVQTTEYINYFIDDLIKLDGKLTKGNGGNAESNTEKQIINELMTSILRTDNGKKVVLNALSKASEKGLTANDITSGELMEAALKDTAFQDGIIKDITYDTSALNSIKYNGTSQSLKAYFDNAINSLILGPKEELLAIAARNKDAFIKIIVETYERAKLIGNIDIPITNINDFVYEFIIKNPNLTDSEINSLLLLADDSDLDKIVNLYEHLLPSNLEANGFSFTGLFGYNRLSGTYPNEIVSLQDNNTITFNSAEDNLIVAFKGTINVNNQNYTSSSITVRTIPLVNGNNTITLPKGSSIYSLETKTLGSEIGKSVYYDGNVTLGVNANYNRSAEYKLKNNNNSNISFSLGNIKNKNIAVKLFFTYKGDIQINNGDINYNSNGIDITNENTITIKRNGSNVTISDLRIKYSATVGDISYTITQYLVPQGETPSKPTSAYITSSQLSSAEYIMGAGERTPISLVGAGTSSGATISNVTGPITFYKSSTGTAIPFDYLLSQAVANVEIQFNGLSEVAKDVAIRGMSEAIVNNKQLTITKPAYVFVQAKSTGDINLNGVDKAVIPELEYYAYYLDTAKTYTITGTAAIGKVYIMDNDTRITKENRGSTDILKIGSGTGAKSILELDYSALKTFENDILAPIFTGNDKYTQFERTYNLRHGLDKPALRRNDQIELIMTLFPTMKNTTGENLLFKPNESIAPEQRIFKNDDLINIVKMLAKADYKDHNSALGRLVNEYNEANGIKKIIIALAKNNDMKHDLAIKLQEMINLSNNEGAKDLFKAAYIGNDFIDKYNTYKLQESKLSILLNGLALDYQFIISDREISPERFKSLMNLIGFDLNTEGYGIYALSSSKGILNGSFIPDNVPLDSLNKRYDKDLRLTVTPTSGWRERGALDSTVNNAVLNEMKQLIKSISTTIFELDFIDKFGTIHHSSTSSIDLKNKRITYYVPTGYIASLADKSLEVYGTPSIANNATKEIKPIAMQAGEIADKVIITAEDGTVASYTIIFEEIDINFNLTYDDGSAIKAIDSAGGRIDLNVSSNTAKLPEGMDLRAYLRVEDINGNIIPMDSAYRIINEDDNFVVDRDGNAKLSIEIIPTLHHGEYTIYVDIFSSNGGHQDSVTLNKNPSSLSEITLFEYDGSALGFTLKNGVYDTETYIEFGRAFDYEELTNKESARFYLTALEYSSGATIDITATKESPDNIMTYRVQYVVTAENGSSTTYVHRLIEKNPFNNQDSYATVYENGQNMNKNLEYSTTSTNEISVSFNRGVEPQYSVKYQLGNFYLLDNDNISYEASGDNNNYPGYSITDIYSGMMVTVGRDCEPGTYIFNYKYISKGIWDGNIEYTREYTFPSLKVIKEYSKDSSLKKISFIESHAIASSIATIMDPENVIRPNVDKASLGANEINYEDVNEGNRKIKIDKGVIDYGSYANRNDYFTIGTISNVNLDSYSPTFKIEEHAEIYISTTMEKLTYFGANQGAKTDMQVLTNHDTTFIYVPFVSNANDHEVFLIQIENGLWTNVYPKTFTGVEPAIATYDSNTNSFSYDGKSWTKEAFAGKADKENYSLSTDYIGTPQEGHFWYVSYAIFSENYLHTTNNNDLTYYHIALIDQTNTIYFDISLHAPKGFSLNTIFVTLAYNKYEEGTNNKVSNQISGYVSKSFDDASTDIVEYMMETQLQILPSGYYYFLVDLPIGYKAEARVTNNKPNRNDKTDTEAGAYLPPSSIVTQRISIEITVTKDMNSSAGSWGVGIGDIGTKQAIFVA